LCIASSGSRCLRTLEPAPSAPIRTSPPHCVPSFRFRGSLGPELRGHDAFGEYVRSVRAALADYNCEILDCVAEQGKAFAKICFSGIHVAAFRGQQPTGKEVRWLGAALFRIEGELIAELWVLGDLIGLDAVLTANAKSN
jgi:predicted ester cyclase